MQTFNIYHLKHKCLTYTVYIYTYCNTLNLFSCTFIAVIIHSLFMKDSIAAINQIFLMKNIYTLNIYDVHLNQRYNDYFNRLFQSKTAEKHQ